VGHALPILGDLIRWLIEQRYVRVTSFARMKANASWIIRHDHLIPGDRVIVIGQQNTRWMRIRYAGGGKSSAEVLKKKQDVAR
jgi:hypothetical protein